MALGTSYTWVLAKPRLISRNVSDKLRYVEQVGRDIELKCGEHSNQLPIIKEKGSLNPTLYGHGPSYLLFFLDWILSAEVSSKIFKLFWR